MQSGVPHNSSWAEDSVGIVTPITQSFDQPLQLKSGKVLSSYKIVYETYGELNREKSNAVLICHALSGDHHVAGYHSTDDKKPGWWDSFIGPGRVIDTSKFFVICTNNIGGCSGSTGPSSINPSSGMPYGPDFPVVTIEDWVKTQALLLDVIGINSLAAVIGGSMGGMQALQWAIDYPHRVKNSVVIAAAPKLSTQNIAFNDVARKAIMSDPNFAEGRYYENDKKPDQGLMLARMLGHITYLSDEALKDKFGRDIREGELKFHFDTEFEIEKYLRYQGEKFVGNFDANTYLLMTKALDYYDPARLHDDDLCAALAHVTCDFFVASFTSDWRFNPSRSMEIVKALIDDRKNVSYLEIEAPHGHDGFLMDVPVYMQGLRSYLDRVAAKVGGE